MTEEAVGVAAIARLLGVHKNTVYGKATEASPAPDGSIPGFRVGRVWRFYPGEVREHLRKSKDPWAL